MFWGCWVMLCYLELRFGLLLVHRELREWLLQRAGLGRVILPLLLQDFSPLLVVFEPEGKTQSNREREIKEFHQFLVIFFVGRKKSIFCQCCPSWSWLRSCSCSMSSTKNKCKCTQTHTCIVISRLKQKLHNTFCSKCYFVTLLGPDRLNL